MKILAINGSHRGREGYTQWLLDLIAEGAGQSGAVFQTIVLAQTQILPCKGCGTCKAAERVGSCIHDGTDDMKSILDAMAAADILIYASPVYVFGVTGMMKLFLDRFNSTAASEEMTVTQSGLLFPKITKTFHAKPLVVLTCCGNIEPETYRNVVSYFQTYARFLDAPIVGTLTRTLIGEFEKCKAGKADENSPLSEVARAYIQAGRELASLGRITKATEKKANQNIIGIPCFDLLMKFRWFKNMAIKRGN
ncbi:MAG: flavodoxin family protein [Negativicutes bacterium]|nr:flavodoxin family protein [Negativicutes bacterium]